MDRAPSEAMRSSTRSDRPGTGSTFRASPGQSPGLGRLASNSSIGASITRAPSGLSEPCSAAHLGLPIAPRPGSRGSNRGLSLPADGSVRSEPWDRVEGNDLKQPRYNTTLIGTGLGKQCIGKSANVCCMCQAATSKRSICDNGHGARVSKSKEDESKSSPNSIQFNITATSRDMLLSVHGWQQC